jgi:hypothetical protein
LNAHQIEYSQHSFQSTRSLSPDWHIFGGNPIT